MDRSFGPELAQIIKDLHSVSGSEGASLTLGKDGGLRLLSPDSVLNARGLNNDQIQRYMEVVGFSEEKRRNFQDIDGTGLSDDELFHPVDIVYPKPWSEEKKAAMIRIVDKQTKYIQTMTDRFNLTLEEKLGLHEAQNQAFRDEMALASPEEREQYEEKIRSNQRQMDRIRELIDAEAANK